jgi:hypothetical protein
VKNKILLISLAAVLAISLSIVGCTGAPPAGVEGTLQIGGLFGLTGPWAEDCGAVLAGFQDYADWVNAHHKVSPWGASIPVGVNFTVVSMNDGCVDSGLALTNYEIMKENGLLVQRISGSAIAQALMSTLISDEVGATSQASGSYLLKPTLATIFMNYPIYTDQLAAIADWFMAKWLAGGNTTAARVCYLNNDSFGRSVPIPAMTAYLQSKKFVVVLPNQEVSSTPTESPTAAWNFIKDNDIDLVLGAHTCIGSVPLMQWATDEGIGLNLAYNVTFGFCSPSHLCVFLRDVEDPETDGNGLVVAGSYPCWDSGEDGVDFCLDLQELYGTNITHIMYLHGVVEAMIQVEAMRLALANTGKSPADLTTADVLNNGFRKISGLDTGGIIPTTLTYGTTDIEGAETVVLNQNQAGENVELGTWPLRHVY